MKEDIKTVAIALLIVSFIINIAIISLLIDIMNDKTQLILDLQEQQKTLQNEISNLKVRAEESMEAFYNCNDVLVEKGLVGE